MSFVPTRTLLLASAALSLSLALPALAQRVPELPQPAVPDPGPGEILDNKGIERRLERDEKALKELRQIVLQAKAQGNPVTVKDAGPDPQVQALDARLHDLEETLRRQTGQMEETSHNAQVAAKAAADAQAANQQLAARVDRLEQALQAAGAASLGANGAPPPSQGQFSNQYGQADQAPPPPQGQGTGGVLGTMRGGQGGPRDIQADPNAGTGRGGRATARIDDNGGDAAAAGPADEQGAYRAARQTLDSGDYTGGAQALQDFLQRYPSSGKAPEANYWLGRTLALRNMHAEAAGAYARALRGWPQTTWGGDAVLRLSTSLVELKRGADACKAVAEFDTRYAKASSAALKTRAREIKSQAGCG